MVCRIGSCPNFLRSQGVLGCISGAEEKTLKGLWIGTQERQRKHVSYLINRPHTYAWAMQRQGHGARNALQPHAGLAKTSKCIAQSKSRKSWHFQKAHIGANLPTELTPGDFQALKHYVDYPLP